MTVWTTPLLLIAQNYHTTQVTTVYSSRPLVKLFHKLTAYVTAPAYRMVLSFQPPYHMFDPLSNCCVCMFFFKINSANLQGGINKLLSIAI